jgi:AcrR family transcriptional regulator
MAGAQRREQLLEVTSGLITEDGFASVSIQSVARRAGITRPIVYEHFGDLAGLLQAVIEWEMARALTQVRATRLPALATGDPIELMLGSLRNYLTAVEHNPRTWRLVLLPPEGAPELLRTSIQQGRRTVLASMIGAVDPGLATGSGGPDPELTARMLSAMADEYARLVLADPRHYAPERLVAHARWFLEQHGRLSPVAGA